MDRTVADGFKDMKKVLMSLREEFALQEPQFHQMQPASRCMSFIFTPISIKLKFTWIDFINFSTTVVHPFSAVNVEEQRNAFQTALSGVRQRLEQCKRLASEVAPAQPPADEGPLRRLVTALKEKINETTKLNKLQSTLQTCQHMAMKYLEKRPTIFPPHVPLQPDSSVVSPQVIKAHEARQELVCVHCLHLTETSVLSLCPGQRHPQAKCAQSAPSNQRPNAWNRRNIYRRTRGINRKYINHFLSTILFSGCS